MAKPMVRFHPRLPKKSLDNMAETLYDVNLSERLENILSRNDLFLRGSFVADLSLQREGLGWWVDCRID